ncbi:4'-phosphopantetheinyl transferase family protein [Flavobacterium psychrotolerans]|uniref:Phosphopantetheinyl transferase n=1 Tax=Flavobacterium psychrotolerans TaxID=2169410 RepID=A0A2U1JLS9_9FLAO|nr:4'-phosphopantetheinyl transferase superfamily protein [Flavobacterium psychrotolerans]PWA05939.1 phosphopantetheinyl transferase [Flavobacterium psychrotolerans]
MIGNDIVDLALSRKESNWKRKGFFEKIFSEKEQVLILNSENPEIMVWNLWTRKEAAYKIYNRQTGIRGFFPLQLECQDITNEIGKVICKGNCYFTKTKITSKYIQTIALVCEEDFERVVVLDNNTKIKKYNGIPFIAPNGKQVSISHHGLYKQIVTLNN